MAEGKQIGFCVSIKELEALEQMKGTRTWRETLLEPLGISTKRRKTGPKRVD